MRRYKETHTYHIISSELFFSIIDQINAIAIIITHPIPVPLKRLPISNIGVEHNVMAQIAHASNGLNK